MLWAFVLIPWVLTVLFLLAIIIWNKRNQEIEEDDDFMDEYDEKDIVRVAVYGEKAYWVYDNVFYESDITREPDFSTARPIDTMDLPPKELNKLLAILDDLEESQNERD